MIDGFWHGLLGGLFAPAVARWLRRFKYPSLFFGTVLAVHISAFLRGWFYTDFFSSLERSVKLACTLEGFLAPIAVGFLVLITVGSLSLNFHPKKTDEEKDQ
jgi:hypothetical protein